MPSKPIYLFISAVAGLAAFFGWKLTARAAYESAEYAVIQSDGEFEIREYPELTVVTTSTRFERQGGDGSFMRLFRYISGANETKQKVAMTTPVFMQPESDQAEGKMAFVIPKKVAAEGTPEPTSEQVAVQKRAAGRYAVIRFSGRMTPQSFAASEQKLREWMTQHELAAASDAESAGYDPPWTPGPLRRNEVLIRLK
jgi:DNA gyrase inhibitor GyrI